MRKLLIFIVVLYAVWRVLQIVGRRLRRAAPGADAFSRYSGARGRAGGEPEQLVACARCGTLLPTSRALPGPGGQHFCSPACRDTISEGRPRVTGGG